MLTKKELKQLRDEIVLGSIYGKDYINSLNISPNDVYNFFEGYLSYLQEIRGTDDLNTLYDVDTINTLYDWYKMFEEDPLPKQEN